MFRVFRVQRVGRRSPKPNDNLTIDLPIPAHFRCPISLDLMKDPVTLSTGITYDRHNIDAWLDAGNRTCPVTNQDLKSLEKIPNRTLMRRIQEWCVENHWLGVERIPTPHIPTTPAEVSAILAEIANASRCGNLIECAELVKKICVLRSEGERDCRCIEADETASGVFAGAFEAFAGASMENYRNVLEEILSMVVSKLPFDDESLSRLGSHASLRCLVWFLSCGNLAGRRNALVAVKELASSSEQFAERLMETEGLMEALVKVLKVPICQKTTKDSLMAMFYLVTSSSPSSDRFVEMGLLPLLLEMIVDSEKSACERALGVLDGILGCEGGRENAYNHALAVPCLVKKILRVSDLATEFAISALWKLCKSCSGEDEEGGILVEALQVGAFQKVLLVLQIGCSERTKEKATELLKLLNCHRVRGECIESMDFKQLKRPF